MPPTGWDIRDEQHSIGGTAGDMVCCSLKHSPTVRLLSAIFPTTSVNHRTSCHFTLHHKFSYNQRSFRAGSAKSKLFVWIVTLITSISGGWFPFPMDLTNLVTPVPPEKLLSSVFGNTGRRKGGSHLPLPLLAIFYTGFAP